MGLTLSKYLSAAWGETPRRPRTDDDEGLDKYVPPCRKVPFDAAVAQRIGSSGVSSLSEEGIVYARLVLHAGHPHRDHNYVWIYAEVPNPEPGARTGGYAVAFNEAIYEAHYAAAKRSTAVRIAGHFIREGGVRVVSLAAVSDIVAAPDAFAGSPRGTSGEMTRLGATHCPESLRRVGTMAGVLERTVSGWVFRSAGGSVPWCLKAPTTVLPDAWASAKVKVTAVFERSEQAEPTATAAVVTPLGSPSTLGRAS